MDLEELAVKVESLYKEGGIDVVSELKSPGGSPGGTPRMKALPEVEDDENESLDEINAADSVSSYSASIKGKPLHASDASSLDVSLGSITKPLPECPPTDSEEEEN